VGRQLLVGRSRRTNEEGIAALRVAVAPYGYTVHGVAVQGALHLKSACTALPDGRLLVNEQVALQELGGFDLVPVPAQDPWGANVASVNGHVCAASEHAPTNEMLAGLGYSLVATPLSEFAKAEGAVTCMSLIIPPADAVV
jgi:dimethylargininase